MYHFSEVFYIFKSIRLSRTIQIQVMCYFFFLSLQGALGSSPNSSQTFFVNAMIQKDKTYMFNNQFKIDNTFTLVEFLPYNGTSVNCLMAIYDSQHNQKLYLQPVSCSYQGMSACYKQDKSIFTPCIMNPFDFLFDQGLQSYREEKVSQNRCLFHLHFTEAFFAKFLSL